MSNVRFVGSAEVVAWGRDNRDAVPESAHKRLDADRGRLPAALVTAYEKANRGRKYQVGKGLTVAVKVPSTNKRGVTSRRSVEVSYDEAREIASLASLPEGVEVGERGRLSAEALDHVGAALLAD